MPTLSVFFGIIIRMFNELNGHHSLPHIHAEYQGQEVVVSLDGEVKLVLAWIEIHQEDLLANWKLLSEGAEYFKIDPLR